MNQGAKIAWLLGAALAVADGSAARAEDRQIPFGIAAQPLSAALIQFARQSGRQLLYSPQLVEGLRARPVQGRYVPAGALSVILSGSGLQFRQTPAGVFLLAAAPRTAAPTPPQPARSTRNIETPDLPELVVTARQREERPQEVPMAISVLGSAALQRFDVHDTAALTYLMPSIQFSDYAPGAGKNDRATARPVVMRGLGLSNDYGVTAAALIFLDGAPLLGGELPVTSDIDRVEVLKGPQSVYFGRSTLSGAVNYVSKAIADRPTASAEVKIASFHTVGLEGSVSFPLAGPALAVRISGRSADNGGYYVNRADPAERVGARTTQSGAVTVEARPTASLRIKAYANLFSNRDGPSAAGEIPASGANCTVGGERRVFCGQIPDVGAVGVYQNNRLSPETRDFLYAGPLLGLPFSSLERRMGFQRNGLLSDVAAEYALADGAVAQSLTGYHMDQTVSSADTTEQPFAPGNLYALYQHAIGYDTWDFSQEFRLRSRDDDRLRWTAGASYISGSSRVESRLHTVTAAGASSFYDSGVSQNRTRTYGVFGGAYYRLADPLTLGVEARYQWDNRTDVGANGAALSAVFRSFSPRVSVDYRLTPAVTAYGSWAQGSRPGGFNRTLIPYRDNPQIIGQLLAAIGEDDIAYREEKLSIAETGVKVEALDRRLRLDANLYYGRLSDQQSQRSAFIPSLNSVLNVTTNQGELSLYGLEMEAAWAPTRRLTLYGNLGWNLTRIERNVCQTCIVYTGVADLNQLQGKQLATAPKVSAFVGADFRERLGSGAWDWLVHIDFDYRGRRNLSVFQSSWIAARHLMNLRLGVDNGAVAVEGFVTNLLNDRTYSAGGVGLDFGSGQYSAFSFGLPEPRIVGLRVRYRSS